MEKIIDEFLNYKDDDNNNTRTSYSGDLILFSNFLRKKNITSFYVVTPKIIEDFYTSNFLDNYERIWKNKSGKTTKKYVGKRSDSSKNRIISTLSSFYKYLVFTQRISNSPVPKRSSKNNSESQALSYKEIEIILNYIKNDSFSKYPKRDRLIIETLYYCGLRVSELVKIKIEDLKLQNTNPYIIIQGKGSKFRDQPIPKIMNQNLVDYINIERKNILPNKVDSKYLFISKYGAKKESRIKNLTRHQINKIVTKVTSASLAELNLSNKKSGKTKYKKISPHMFRHAIGTHLHKSGVDIIKVRDHLGHSSVATTSRYVQKDKEKTKILNKYGPISGRS